MSVYCGDGEPLAYYRETPRVARKEHECCACEISILPGHKYWVIAACWDGRVRGWKRCDRSTANCPNELVRRNQYITGARAAFLTAAGSGKGKKKMSEKFDFKSEIQALEGAIASGQITPGFALASLALKLTQLWQAPRADRPCEPVRVSFRKNVEVAPYKHEHVEVTVELNGSSFAEAMQKAKDLADEALGVNVDEDDIAYAQEVLRKAKRAGVLKTRPGKVDQDLENALTWGR